MSDQQERPPSKILAFDSTKAREAEPVDLDSPFFKITRPQYPACDHCNRGVMLDIGTRKVFCLCGEQIDAFDALLIYAHAQRRLVSTRQAIEEHERKEAEKKARRPFVRRVVGFCRRDRFGYDLQLECGHQQTLWRTKPTRSATCETCVRNAKLKADGVAVMETKAVQP